MLQQRFAFFGGGEGGFDADASLIGRGERNQFSRAVIIYIRDLKRWTCGFLSDCFFFFFFCAQASPRGRKLFGRVCGGAEARYAQLNVDS